MGEAAALIDRAQLELDFQGELQDEELQRYYCFKVMSGNPGSITSITAFMQEGGAIWELGALAVTFHVVLPGPAADSLAVDICARPMGHLSAGRVILDVRSKRCAIVLWGGRGATS